MGYERMLGLARHPLGKLVLFGLILLLAWHAMHRIYKSLHDVGIRRARPASWCATAWRW